MAVVLTIVMTFETPILLTIQAVLSKSRDVTASRNGTLGLSTAGEKISPLNPSMTSPTARRMYLRPPGDDSIVLDKNLNLIIAQLK